MITTAKAHPDQGIRQNADHRPGRGVRIEQLVRSHFASLWRLARRWGLPAADADDVAQRTIVVAHERLDDIAEGSERAFLFRTALFLVSRVHRSRRRKPEVELENEEELIDQNLNPEQQLEQARARHRLDRVLSSMPEDLRAVFVLFELEQLTQPEIAEALAIPVGTVASRLRRARLQFVSLLRRTESCRPIQSGALP